MPNQRLAPEESETVLLLIDVINDFDFPDSDQLLRYATEAASNIATLKQRLRCQGIPSIYVNDNFGRWKSDFAAQVRHCARDGCPGKGVVNQLRPEEDDYFVLKPMHSGFYSTTLHVLLEYLRARTLILTGFAGNICVLFTANDAYMRDYELSVPSDCVASNTREDNEYALRQMQQILKADTRPSNQQFPVPSSSAPR